MKINSFTDLEIWQLARIQCADVFKLISKPDFSKDWGLVNQINRSSGSVMDNIAEGFGRTGNQEFINFLLISNGSNAEVQSQLYRAFDRKYLNEDELKDLIEKSEIIHRKIMAFIKYLKQSGIKGYRYKKD
ncbi:MAG: four helix bundle protein [Chitinophagaceae bacterium]|nr:four helix bundle protein [Chitinophagaceae bacterium]MCZ2397297.1 four helix bundle protein [Chitinophagales bacterium]